MIPWCSILGLTGMAQNRLRAAGCSHYDILTGEIAWSQTPPRPACLKQDGCSAAQMAPVTAIPQAVFSGSMDGHLRAYDAQSGKMIWDFDTAKPFKTINGAQAHGGSSGGNRATGGRWNALY